MKLRLSPFTVGFFVLGALALAVFALLSFGAAVIFSKTQRFAVFFEESVSGLDPGAAVKLLGMRVGEVKDISVACNPATRKSVVIVRCDIGGGQVIGLGGDKISLTSAETLRTLVEKGLRAKLNLTGITGLLFVELAFYDPAKNPERYPIDPDVLEPDVVAVPAVPSTISQLSEALAEILPRLRKVDFSGIAEKLEDLLATANRKLESADVEGLLATARTTFGEINAILSRIEKRVDPLSEELTDTLAKANVSLESIRKAMEGFERALGGPRDGFGAEAAGALREIADAAQAVRRLADYLERNPGAIFSGRKPSRLED